MSKSGKLLAALLLFTGACVSSEVTVTGARHPALPQGCPVKIFPSTTPDYKWDDIATAKAKCHPANGRSACIDELKKRACELGGDTLYGFKDGTESEYTIVIGTIGHRNEDTGPSSHPGEIAKIGSDMPKPSSQPAAAPAPSAGSCDPPCSPGYRCTDGQCLALCNPPCGDGMHCNQQRICEATPSQ